MRQRAGRREYLTAWEGYSDSTWEPRSSFVGCDARRKLDAFLLRARSGHGDRGDDETSTAAGAEAVGAAFVPMKGGRPRTGVARGQMGRAYPRAPTPPLVALPKAVPLPHARSWVPLNQNHPVQDQPMSFVPWLGDGELDRERAAEVAMNPLTRRGAHTAADASGTTSQGGTSTGATPPTSTPTVWCPPSVAPLPAGRSPLSSLFCRRCFAYDCVLHPPAQALPRWHYAPICYAQTARPKGEVLSERPTTAPAPALAPKGGIDVSAPLADFVIAANAAVHQHRALRRGCFMARLYV